MQFLIILALMPFVLSGAITLWFIARIAVSIIWLGVKMSFAFAWTLAKLPFQLVALLVWGPK